MGDCPFEAHNRGMWMIAVMGAGALGVGLRWVLDQRIPWDPARGWWSVTLLINVVGSLAMGLLMGWLAARTELRPEWRAVLATGFLGGFTTFSAYSYQAMLLVQRSDWMGAALYGALTPILAIAACGLGLAIQSQLGS